MQIKYKIEVLKLGLSLGLVLLFFSPIIAEEILNQRAAYLTMTETLINPVPVWTQENADFKEDGEAAKGWLTVFNAGPGGQSMISDVYEVDGKNMCSKVAHFIYYYDQAAGQMQRTAMLGDGKLMAGSIEFMGDEGYISIVQFETPDGPMTMKDTTKFVDPNTQSASAHFLNAETGEWDFADSSFWRRADEKFQNPCG